PMLASRGARRADDPAIGAGLPPRGPLWRTLVLQWSAFPSLGAAWQAMHRRPWTMVAAPYVLLRFVVQLLLEAFGKLLLGCFLLVAATAVLLGKTVALIVRPWLLPLVDRLAGVGRSWARAYPPMLRWSLRHRGLVAMAAALSFGAMSWGAWR